MNMVLLLGGVVVVMIVMNIIGNRGITQVSAQAAGALAADSGTTVIDVRSPEEFRGGHIKGARLLPVSEIVSRVGEIAMLKDKPVLVYCHAGSRSLAASQILRKNGFTKVSNLQGGITAWNNAGFKTVNGK